MNVDFDRFINFGSIADSDIRKKLSETIFKSLQKEKFENIGISNSEINNFSGAVNSILSNDTMRKLCSDDTSLAEEITHNILDFIKNTNRQIQKTENPFEAERQCLDDFKEAETADFEENWEKTSSFIRKTYKPQDIDTDFYNNEFQNCLTPDIEKDKKSKKKEKISFQSVKEHFVEKWETILLQKQIQWELEQIEEARKEFCEKLYKQIEELKKMQDILEPFTGKLGRLWDMSKGSLQRANFDILKRYAGLLQKDKSLQELAEMLGRMQSAEIEYEEEIFTDKITKPEWKIEHASKSDLVGIHESDDISSMLPAEAALLAEPVLEPVFYKKFAEKKLQTFDYQAKTLSYREEEFQNKRQKAKEDKKGPIIICVDTSGSMHDIPERVAKTLCFALLKMAVRDNRKCYLILFSTDIKPLDLTDFKNNLEKLIEFLLMSFHDGTDGEPAIEKALEVIKTKNNYKKADVIMVSDFVMPDFNEQIINHMFTAKENKTKFHSLMIGESGNKNVLEKFDVNWVYNLNNSDHDSILQLVKDINGIYKTPENQ